MKRNAFAYFLTFFLLSSPLQASRTFEVHALTSPDESEVSKPPSVYSSPHLLRNAGIDDASMQNRYTLPHSAILTTFPYKQTLHQCLFISHMSSYTCSH